MRPDIFPPLEDPLGWAGRVHASRGGSILEVDVPGAVEELPHLYAGLGVPPAIGVGWELDQGALRAHSIIVEHRGPAATR